MKKVILIAFYFNQVNEIASKRLRALAKYLPQFAWEPIVIVPDLGAIPKENDNLNCRVIYTEYEDMFTHFSKKFKNSKPSDSNGSNVSDRLEEDKLKDSTSFPFHYPMKSIKAHRFPTVFSIHLHEIFCLLS